MRLLVTGGAGFIGSNFVRYWCEAHPEDNVVVLDALTYAGCRESLSEVEDKIDFIHGDMGDKVLVEQVLREHRIDVVVNFAAESHNSLAIIDPQRFFNTNVMSTLGLLDACRSVGVARLHHVSTCEVYGDLALDSNDSFNEASPYRPRTPYNASKAASDHAVRSYYYTYGLPISITNCANNYGPYQFPEKVIPLFATNALDDLPLPLYSSKDNKREWIHVLDHARAIDMVIDKGEVGETYHVGTELERSVEELADQILSILNKPSSLKTIVPDRPSHDRRYLLDSSKIRGALGWEPIYDFQSGLEDTVRWYRDNRAWWEPLKKRAPVDESGVLWSERKS